MIKRGKELKGIMKTISVYIHWPYCEKKCPYCDFNSHVTSNVIDSNFYSRIYLKSLKYYEPILKSREVKSIFFGGGTPSLSPPEVIAELIQYIVSITGQKAEDIEITMEANPSSTEMNKMRAFKEAGINRVSLGAQSFNDANLRFLGRLHNAKNAISAIETINNIFDSSSFDLIYALPHQTRKEWQDELRNALSFESKHMSLYQLTIEEGTKFFNMHKKGALKEIDQDLAANMYDDTQEIMAQVDMPYYEVSNHAKEGYESLHNMRYWESEDFIGIGPGAHGRLNMNAETQYIEDDFLARTKNAKEGAATSCPSSYGRGERISVVDLRLPNKWNHSMERQNNAIESVVRISERENREERIMMGMRCKKGISISQNNISFSTLESLLSSGMVLQDGDRVYASRKGVLLLNQIIYKLIEG